MFIQNWAKGDQEVPNRSSPQRLPYPHCEKEALSPSKDQDESLLPNQKSSFAFWSLDRKRLKCSFSHSTLQVTGCLLCLLAKGWHLCDADFMQSSDLQGLGAQGPSAHFFGSDDKQLHFCFCPLILGPMWPPYCEHSTILRVFDSVHTLHPGKWLCPCRVFITCELAFHLSFGQGPPVLYQSSVFQVAQYMIRPVCDMSYAHSYI